MKKLIILILSAAVITGTGCRKKEMGVCYCSYYSGDRTHYDLKSLSRDQQGDSCNVLDHNASAFAGSCKLK